jgi:hypothetical protein
MEASATENIANEQAWKAVIQYLSWTKFWYGEFFGERCYRRLVGKRLPVTFSYHLNSLSQPAESTNTNECQSERRRVFLNYGNVEILGTNTLFKLHGLSDVTTRPYKYRAFIVLGCSSDASCSPNEEYHYLLNRSPDGESLESPWTHSSPEITLIPEIQPLDMSTWKESPHHAHVLKAVQRSMVRVLTRYYVDGPSGERRAEISPALLADVKGHRKMLVGKFFNADPGILVYYEGDRQVYYVDFPKAEILSDDRYCMHVFSADPYLGYDLPRDEQQREAIMEELVQKLNVHSIELLLPEDWWGS